jgi:hypothetical protein
MKSLSNSRLYPLSVTQRINRPDGRASCFQFTALRSADVGSTPIGRDFDKKIFFLRTESETTTENRPRKKITNSVREPPLKSMNPDRLPLGRNAVAKITEIRGIVNNNINERMPAALSRPAIEPSRELSILRGARVTQVYYSLTCQLTLVCSDRSRLLHSLSPPLPLFPTQSPLGRVS